MKTILILSLICFGLTVTDDEKGPAYNLKHSQSEEFCIDYNPFLSGEVWTDAFAPGGVSDCVDLLLWNGERYYDRCCYIRFQLEGDMHGGCIGLSEEHYLDITETIRRIEAGDKNLWTSGSANSKVYQLDCDSSYLKFLSIASILLALIF